MKRGLEMNLKEHIQNKEETIQITEQELKILRQMKKINESVYELQELVIDYEEWGYDINKLQPFLDNYPFRKCLFDHNPSNQWGDKKNENKGKIIPVK